MYILRYLQIPRIQFSDIFGQDVYIKIETFIKKVNLRSPNFSERFQTYPLNTGDFRINSQFVIFSTTRVSR